MSDGDLTDRFTHLPAWARVPLDKYEHDLADGEITFTKSDFADQEAADVEGGWIQSCVALHLSIFDSVPEEMAKHPNAGRLTS